MLPAVGLLLAALIQSTIVEALAPGWAQVDLVILLVVAWSSLKGRVAGLRGALLGGLAMDVLGSNPLGLTVLTLLPGVYLAGWLRERLAEPVFEVSVMSVVVGTAFVEFAEALYLAAVGGFLPLAALTVRAIVPTAVSTGLASALLMPALSWLAAGEGREAGAFLRRTLPRVLWQ